MKIGVPKEIKPQENRIGLTPESVKTLVSEGHEVLVENNGGFEAGFDNDQYKSAGAKIIDKAEDIFNDSEIIVKVKEPLAKEVKMIKENQIVFTYLHLAAAKELTQGLIDSKSVCIAYETVTDNNGCTITKTATITQPDDLTITETITDFEGFEISCFGANDADINIEVNGGTPNYTYQWSTSTGGTGLKVNQADQTGLSPGTYKVVVTDDNGCEVSVDFDIIEPDIYPLAIQGPKSEELMSSIFGLSLIHISEPTRPY